VKESGVFIQKYSNNKKEEIVRRKARYFGSCVYVAPGFIVKLGGKIGWMAEEFFEVLAVTQRYGAINGGETRQHPVLDLRGIKTGKIQYCDNSFIQEVLERQTLPVGLPENYFRNRKSSRLSSHALIKKERGIWSGNLVSMIAEVLSTLSLNLPRRLHGDRACNLYLKQGAGLVKVFDEDSPIIVYAVIHIKPFRKWVRKNALRLMATVAEISERETRENMMWEKDFEEELQMDMDEDARKEEAVIPSCPGEG